MQKHLETSLLNIAYEEDGDENAPVIILLHGFPYDAKSWHVVSKALVEKGYRTLAPYHRGYGKTSFLSDNTMRSGQYTALVSDIIEFSDALQLKDFIIIGHDWGATTGYELAALYPQKVKALVALATTYNGKEQQQPSLPQIQAYWYQWYFYTQQGYAELKEKRRDFCHHLWQAWSPVWKFDKDEFETTAAAWDNPDFVDIVIHSYRHRWKNVAGDAQYEILEKQLKENSQINIPVIFLQGDKDGASLPESSLKKEHFFTNYYERRMVENTGHTIQIEKPEAVIQAFKDIVALIKGK